MFLVADIWTALDELGFFSLVLKLYAKWGLLVSHIFFCVCVLTDSEIFFFNDSHFL